MLQMHHSTLLSRLKSCFISFLYRLKFIPKWIKTSPAITKPLIVCNLSSLKSWNPKNVQPVFLAISPDGARYKPIPVKITIKNTTSKTVDKIALIFTSPLPVIFFATPITSFQHQYSQYAHGTSNSKNQGGSCIPP